MCKIQILAFGLNLLLKHLLQNLKRRIFSSEPRRAFCKTLADEKVKATYLKNIKS